MADSPHPTGWDDPTDPTDPTQPTGPDDPVSGPRDRLPELGEGKQPWVETKTGGLFFINAVLVAPEIFVLLPLIAGGFLRAIGLLQGTSRFIDTIPQVAVYVLPWVGWLVVVPIFTVVKNLRMTDVPSRARRALQGMLGLHLAFLGWTVWLWFGSG